MFTLRKGVRFHDKPPVNGREVTADDVRYTFERMLTEKGSNASMYRSIAKVEAVGPLHRPVHALGAVRVVPRHGRQPRWRAAIIARECVEKFGDLKKPEAVIGTGPWMLERYRPNVSLTLVRNPNYFVPGLPYIDRVEMLVDEDNASRMAAFLGGKYDLGWEFPGQINRTDWIQIKDRLRQTRPEPADRRVPVERGERPRHAHRSEAVQRRAGAPGDLDGHRPAGDDRLDARGGRAWSTARCPAALTDWALPIDQLGEGARNYATIPAEAKRLLAAAGTPTDFPASVCFNSYGSTVLVDSMQLVLRNLKAVGIDAKLDQKEYGAYQATCRLGKFDSMVFGPLTPFLEPDNFLFGQYYTGEPRNRSHVKDPVLDDLLVRQRRAMDVKRRREVINDIQRHLAKQQYYVHAPAGTYIAVWDGALKNYGPNLGYDYGGRLVAAWLDR